MSGITVGLDRYAWWQRATQRERVALGVAAVVIITAFIISVVIMPVRDALVRAPRDRAQRKALMAQARQRVAAIQSLNVIAAPRTDARASIARALDRQGVARSDATIDTANDRIVLTLPAVRIAVAAAIMDTLTRDGLRVAGATLAARADSPDLRAEITFMRAAP
jgi:hypothetical protein